GSLSDRIKKHNHNNQPEKKNRPIVTTFHSGQLVCVNLSLTNLSEFLLVFGKFKRKAWYPVSEVK
ncbi:MAG: hypothetical protein IJF95_08430, partial [Erysipelotrichaceae bacterium]|nr:hypothetical protein [Erysipelotrichaceae bacterium]